MNLQDNINKIISSGIALLPVHEVNKNPLLPKGSKWSEIENLTALELWDLMDRFRTSSVCMICGIRSGGLVCIDIDSKYNKEIAPIVFRDLELFYKDFWEKVRIEKTPSGGFHILFKVSGSIPKCSKVASRMSTPEELEERSEKTKCFIEIKGEGGLSQCFPSIKYEVVFDREIPLIERELFDEILGLLKSYNEIIVEEKPIFKPTKELDIYSENPYLSFDGSEAGSKVLLDAGWAFFNKNATYDYYSKPDKGKKGVSAGFNRSKRLYTIFTASTELETKSYSPSNLKCALEFNGDKKKFYAWLVANKYGTLKPKFEESLINRVAKFGGELPSNISEQGLFRYNEIKKVFDEKYAFGVFWIESEGNFKISRENMYNFATKMGYRIKNGSILKIEGFLIKKLTDNDFYNEIKDYMGYEDTELLDCYENFLQNSGKFTISRLKPLEEDIVLKSNKNTSYKFYLNGYLEITKDSYRLLGYEGLEFKVYEDSIQQRNFIEGSTEGIYKDFLDKAIGYDEYLRKCIGYYAHEYRDEEGYLILTTEECENPKFGGGSGKNVFWGLFKLTTTFKSTAASMIKTDNNLLQSWNGERVFCLSDIPKKFDFIFFKDIITGSAVVKKLYKDEYTVDISDMCKIGGSSNYSFDATDPGLNRRIRAIEFTEYFTKVGGVKKEYGKMFPMDWDENDYSCFDNVIIECIQEYLNSGCVIDKKTLTHGGWVKQFNQNHKSLYEFIKENIDEWVEARYVKNEDFNRQYERYRIENNIKHALSSYTVNIAIEEYCEYNKIIFDKDKRTTIDGARVRCRYFEKETKEITEIPEGYVLVNGKLEEKFDLF